MLHANIAIRAKAQVQNRRSRSILTHTEVKLMPERLVKITIPLPENNLAGADTESLWAEPVGGNAFKIKNVPFMLRA